MGNLAQVSKRIKEVSEYDLVWKWLIGYLVKSKNDARLRINELNRVNLNLTHISSWDPPRYYYCHVNKKMTLKEFKEKLNSGEIRVYTQFGLFPVYNLAIHRISGGNEQATFNDVMKKWKEGPTLNLRIE